MPLPQTLTLSEAADEIRGTSGRHPRPFFFMVGAGISHPTIPLAPALVEHFREQAGSAQPPSNQTAMDAYAWWFGRAYASPGDRQQYLQKLIEGKPITDANLRLAHLLLGGKFANLVVTTNFDDFISKALTLFGETHIVCDHPRTVLRIDPEREGLQIVHVHGSHWFYDCCNLAGEIEERAVNSRDDPSSMRDFLDRLLLNRSPIVVGYSGWEGDVFMSALKRRMKAGLKFNVYWFCYKAANIGALPPFLQSSRDVRFVVRGESPKTSEDGSGGGKEWLRAGRATREGESRQEPVLRAADVFDELIRQFNLEAPLLTRDPLGYLAEHLRRSLPRAEEGTAGQDLYRIGQVIETVEGAKAALKRAVLEPLRDALRRSQYREAVRQAERIGLIDLDSDQVREVMVAMTDAASGLFDNSPEELAAYELTLAAGARLLELGGSDAESCAKVAWALLYKGVTLGQLNRSEEEIAAYDEVARRFGEATEPALRKRVAMALFNKGFRLGQLKRSEEAIAVCDEVARRFGEATEPALREQVAMALFNKGATLGQLNRSEEAIAVFDEVARRFGEAAELALRKQVAGALVNKGIALGQLNRSEEEIAACDEVTRRFGEATEPALREQVATALVNKGVRLGRLNWGEEAIAVWDEVARRFGEATEPALREQVARALNNSGFTDLCRAKTHRKTGENDQARSALLRARKRLQEGLERNPNSEMILGNLGYVEFLSGERETARRYLERAIAIGGQKIREVELADAERDALPEDEEFKKLVLSIPLPAAKPA